jgi:hypothetical protein
MRNLLWKIAHNVGPPGNTCGFLREQKTAYGNTREIAEGNFAVCRWCARKGL